MKNTKKLLVCVVLIAVFGVGITTLIMRAAGFAYQLQPQVTTVGQAVNASDFVVENGQTEYVSAAFFGMVDFNTPGRQNVTLTLRRNSRAAQATAALYVAEVADFVYAELGNMNIAPEQFIINAREIPSALVDVRFNSPIAADGEILPVGSHRVFLMFNGVLHESVLRVVDTTPPTLETRDIFREMGVAIFPEEVVADTFDLSGDVTVYFVGEPDIFAPGAQLVEVRATDIFGNYTICYATITIAPNTIPPVIGGVRAIHSVMGEPVQFRAGVYAYDAFGRPVDLVIDARDLNINERGSSHVVYIATDAWGLTTKVMVNVHITSVNPILVRERVDELLAVILRDDMTQLQQAQAIFNWIQSNIGLTSIGANGRDSIYESAHLALINRRGNCFNFYGLSAVMLTQAGIPNMTVNRTRYTTSRSQHRWNLINPDGMGWHHFDATPVQGLTRQDRFMFTNSQAAEFTSHLRREGIAIDFFTFDPEGLPEIVE